MRTKRYVFKILLLILTLGIMIIPGSIVFAEDGRSWNSIEDVETYNPDESSQTQSSTGSTTSESSKKETSKPDTSNLDKKLADLKAKSEELRKNLNAVKADKKDAVGEYNAVKAKLDNINGQISIVDEQILASEARIKELDENILVVTNNIEEKASEIDQKELEYQNTYDDFFKRAKIMYKTSISGSSLEVLLGSKSFSTLLRNASIMKKMAEQDQDIMDELVLVKEQIEQDKITLESDMVQLEEDKGETEAIKQDLLVKQEEQKDLRGELKTLTSEHGSIVNTLKKEENAIEGEYQITQEEMAKIESEIQSLYKSATDSGTSFEGTSDGSGFAWPVPGHTKVSMPYMGYAGHTGMDITSQSGPGVINGAGVVAAADGKVIAAIRGYSGYGHYIIIDHGSGYSTLYAHLSAINISKGDSVSRGQNIGNVGSTGNSTAPHLHIEVRINGSPRNPAGYF